MQDYMRDHDSSSFCPKCKADTQSGTHNGCEKCGRVKHQTTGKINK